ncbi:MAG: hypothetical protein QOC71_1211, partial [Thermoplasmata archaeon]|nr:hypothetical protein [Thermoplasmata archaeon]
MSAPARSGLHGAIAVSLLPVLLIGCFNLGCDDHTRSFHWSQQLPAFQVRGPVGNHEIPARDASLPTALRDVLWRPRDNNTYDAAWTDSGVALVLSIEGEAGRPVAQEAVHRGAVSFLENLTTLSAPAVETLVNDWLTTIGEPEPGTGYGWSTPSIPVDAGFVYSLPASTTEDHRVPTGEWIATWDVAVYRS